MLSLRFQEALSGCSCPFDMATQNQRRSVKTTYGPLWQVSRAATDAELPRVLCHFLRTSFSSPVQPESAGAPDRARPPQDESDCELEVRALPKCEAQMRLPAREHTSLSTCLRASLAAISQYLSLLTLFPLQEMRRDFARISDQIHREHQEVAPLQTKGRYCFDLRFTATHV